MNKIINIPSMLTGYVMNKSDGSYRLLFSNPYLVHDLFRGIVDEPWASEFDWSRLAPLPSDYISDVRHQRHYSPTPCSCVTC